MVLVITLYDNFKADIKKFGKGQSDNIGVKSLVLHTAGPDLVPGTAYDLSRPPGMTAELSARSSPWAHLL